MVGMRHELTISDLLLCECYMYKLHIALSFFRSRLILTYPPCLNLNCSSAKACLPHNTMNNSVFSDNIKPLYIALVYNFIN